MMQSDEVINADKKNVSCSGKDYPYDHPIVYLEIDEIKGFIECPYCSKKFILSK
ncbi:MAG: zinc-finger domain-containing protein [Rickettsiaceae bacterium]|nr:zinc-finger domain-containing protein [Rickettsiaceae bacterium]